MQRKHSILLAFSILLLLPFLTNLHPARAQTALPTPTPSPAPELPSQDWRDYSIEENDWTEEDALQAISTLEEKIAALDAIDSDPNAADIYSEKDYRQALEVLLYETIERFPRSENLYSLKLKLLNYLFRENLLYSDHTLELLRSVLDEALSTSKADLNNPGVWLSKNIPGLSLTNLITVDDLFGDGRNAHVYEIINPHYQNVIFALRGDRPSIYQLYLVSDDWIDSWRTNSTFLSDDLNQNGRPEIIVQYENYDRYDGTVSMNIYEWGKKKFQRLDRRVKGFSTSFDPDRIRIEFQAMPEGAKIINFKTVRPVECELEPKVTYPFIEQTTYMWNGTQYAWASQQTEPILNPHRPECGLAWAYEAGPENQQAYAIMQQTLSEWPGALDEVWGPAAEDYFRYQLGTWYAFHGEREQALKTLAQVRDHPTHPEYTAASRMAAAFVKGYQKNNTITGCTAVYDAMLLDIYTFTRSSGSDSSAIAILEQFREAWGFGDMRWGMQFEDLVYGSNNHDEAICSLAQAFKGSVREENPGSKEELADFLFRSRLPWTGLQEGDANGDGRADWLVMVRTEEIYLNLWALLREEKEIRPVWISSRYADTRSAVTAWRAFSPAEGVDLINAYQVNGSVELFSLIEENRTIHVEIPEVHRLSSKFSPVYLIDVRQWEEGERLVELTPEGVDYYYEWDAENQVLRYTPDKKMYEPGQSERIAEIEQKLLWGAESAYALQDQVSDVHWRLYGLLKRGGLNGIDVPWQPEKSSLDRLRPYLIYLYGLSNEFSGYDFWTEEAYWVVWHTYPENPFALIARLKLEKNEPEK